MNSKYFNVTERVVIRGIAYFPQVSYRVTQANFSSVRDLADEHKAVFTAEEVDFDAMKAAKKTDNPAIVITEEL